LASTVDLVLAGHGSEFGAHKETVEQLAAILRARSHFLSVQVGFVEMCNPSIHDGLTSVVEAGAEKINVVPVLSEKRHTTQDIPKLLVLEKGRTRESLSMGSRGSVEVVYGTPVGAKFPVGFTLALKSKMLETGIRSLEEASQKSPPWSGMHAFETIRGSQDGNLITSPIT